MVASEQVGQPADRPGTGGGGCGARRYAAHAQRADGAHAAVSERIQGCVAGPMAHGQIGARPGCAELGVNHETLRQWIKTAENAERPEALAESVQDSEIAALQ
ncbi:hypothetical protein AB0I54_45590 [Streptomyces sp. NPDC050625]|uniref:hypothetical protein n=1 Tax=Streptomyces sp. NPDC050625 TaxID=3154629 RepID=UPI003447C3BD